MKINEYFDKVYLINLDHRTDRLKMMDDQLKTLGIEYTRVSGKTIPLAKIKKDYYKHFEKDDENYIQGQHGCKLSHLQIILDARKAHYQRILILEDDAAINPEIDTIFGNALDQLQSKDCSWDMLYFGGNYEHGGFYIDGRRWFQEFIGPNVLKLKGAMKTTAYGLVFNTFDYILANALQSGEEIDVFYYKMIQKQNFGYYAINPPVVIEIDSASDIKN
jgi:GR25 family glycosyltransferase involved in LPS biosynthesis